jgi:RepB DNA-primase from phage plasmid
VEGYLRALPATPKVKDMANYRSRGLLHFGGRPFSNLDNDDDVIRSQRIFLQDIWSDFADGSFMFLAFKKVTTGKWRDHAIKHPDFQSTVSDLLRRYSRWDYDQYFCPNSFSEPRRKQQYALPTPFSWCDMDESAPNAYRPIPNLVWRTSPSRFQALWLWHTTHTASRAEWFSQSLAYRHGGDKNGWSATKMLRIPGSVNHKPNYDEPFVKIIECNWSPIISRPLPLKGCRQPAFSGEENIEANPGKHDPNAVLNRYGKSLHPKVRVLIRNSKAYEPNRSAQIFHIIAGLHEAGASTDEIAAVLWQNPYFIEKHGRDICKLNEELSRVISKLEGAK